MLLGHASGNTLASRAPRCFLSLPQAKQSGAIGSGRQNSDWHSRRCGFDQAEATVATREADMVALARTILYDPRWPWHAAAELGAQVKAPHQYLRS